MKTTGMIAMATVLLLCLSFTGCQSADSALQKKADQGDATAQYDLGLAHANGKDAPQDYTQAVAADQSALWKTDYAVALKQAAAENKYVLVDFSGSDWCGWCIKLDREVFSQKEFIDYAQANLICVLLDFPRGKELPKAQKDANQALLDQYQVQGFPTVLILNPQGMLVERAGYQPGGAANYVELIKGVIAANPAK